MSQENKPQPKTFDASQLSLRAIAIVLLSIGFTFYLAMRVAHHMQGMTLGRTLQPGESSGSERDGHSRLNDAGSPAQRAAWTESSKTLQLTLEKQLHEFRPSDEKGFQCIPIELALGLAVDQLPTRDGPPELDNRTFGLVGGGDSNSGRIYQGAPPWYGD